MKHTYLAEVISTNIREITAQCRELNFSPPFGSLVRIPTLDYDIYALIYNIETSFQSPYQVMAYGKTEEELREEQPQLFELMKTQFQAIIAGYKEGENIRYTLPPHPPALHSFVYGCDNEDFRKFTASTDFLRMIVCYSKLPVDEVLIAFTREAVKIYKQDSSFLIRMGRELSRLFKDDFGRLYSILKRVI